MTVMDLVLVAAKVMIEGVTSNLDAAMLIKAVVDKSGGLSQPESRGNKFAR